MRATERGKEKRPKDKEKQGKAEHCERSNGETDWSSWRALSVKPQKAKAVWIKAPVWQDFLVPGLWTFFPQSGRDLPLNVVEM